MQNIGQDSNRLLERAAAWLVSGVLLMMSLPAAGQSQVIQSRVVQSRVIEVLADKNSRFKVAGQDRAEITVKAGEPLLLRIEARKGKTWNRNGAIHGFTLLQAKSRAKVPGWDLELQPGIQEFNLTAPSEPGRYEVLCTVICSGDHEGMRMKFVVLP